MFTMMKMKLFLFLSEIQVMNFKFYFHFFFKLAFWIFPLIFSLCYFFLLSFRYNISLSRTATWEGKCVGNISFYHYLPISLFSPVSKLASYFPLKGLKGISFTVPAGTTTAIVGPTGAGELIYIDFYYSFLF